MKYLFLPYRVCSCDTIMASWSHPVSLGQMTRDQMVSHTMELICLPLVWDATCRDTLATSYWAQATRGAGCVVFTSVSILPFIPGYRDIWSHWSEL